MLGNNLLALVITVAISLIWLRLNDFLAQRGLISSRLSRKIIHMGTGPLFVFCWLLFTPAFSSRFLAALVPFAITLQFALVGLGIVKDQAAVDAMSRTGNPREILRGPLFYGIVFIVLTIMFWLDNPVGIIALMMLCGGDGLAEIIGRRWGKKKIFNNPNKTWIGSLGFFFGGWVFAAFVIAVFASVGVFQISLAGFLFSITIITLVSTIIEAITPSELDNITVPLTAVVVGFLLLRVLFE
jgi:phytol kinase